MSLFTPERKLLLDMFILAATAKLAMGVAMMASPHAASHAQTHVVHSGESLWSISAQQNHNYVHLYALNRDKINNPDLIYPGQKLRMDGKVTVPAETTSAVAPAVHSAPQKVWGVTYGYPNQCGDGDSDGWDVSCSKLFPHTSITPVVHNNPVATATTASSSAIRSVYNNVHGGTYSFNGLMQLWTSAGGPSWAASHAASIAMCESGGRTSAYNPSGATGLWQILGSVVSGDLNNAYTNALNAVSKFKASGNTFAQWVCQ